MLLLPASLESVTCIPAIFSLLTQCVTQELGVHPDDGEPVTAAVGAYGPYVRHKRLNASLPEVTMYICVAIVCQSLDRPDSWGRPWLTLYGKAP